MKINNKPFIATRLAFRWYGSYRKIEDVAKDKMAEAVEAEADSIKASKAIYSHKIPSLKAINKLKSQIREYWESMTAEYPEPGVRLLPEGDVEEFQKQMEHKAWMLDQAAKDVHEQRGAIIDDAEKRLGKAFRASNYPDDLKSLFGIEISYPSLQPADNLPGHLQAQQKLMVDAKLKEAVQLTQAAFVQEFKDMVEHLHSKLTPEPDGTQKKFKCNSIDNFGTFFERFAKLQIATLPELDSLVEEAKSLLKGITPKDLKTGNMLKLEIQNGLGKIAEKLTPLVTNVPRRNIVKPPEKLAS